MKTTGWIKLFLVAGVLFLFLILPEVILAQKNTYRNGFMVGGWAGYGQINLNTSTISNSSHGTFALGFCGGYAIYSKVVMGMELNGWTSKTSNLEDPAEGESISNVSIFLNYFPIENLPLFLAGGGGKISYINNIPDVTGRDKGWSWFVGSGYEIPVIKRLVIVPQIRFSRGNFTDGNYQVYELAVGLKWYSGK